MNMKQPLKQPQQPAATNKAPGQQQQKPPAPAPASQPKAPAVKK